MRQVVLNVPAAELQPQRQQRRQRLICCRPQVFGSGLRLGRRVEHRGASPATSLWGPVVITETNVVSSPLDRHQNEDVDLQSEAKAINGK